MKKKRIGRVVTAVILVVVVALVAGLVIPGEDDLPLLGVGFYAVLTQSMSPTIEAGSLVAVRRCEPESIEVGDVITFWVQGALVTHRVVGIEQDADGPLFTTRGDANNMDDPNPVAASQLLGRTVFWIGGLGLLTTNLRTVAILLLVVLIAVWIVADILRKRKAGQAGDGPAE